MRRYAVRPDPSSAITVDRPTRSPPLRKRTATLIGPEVGRRRSLGLDVVACSRRHVDSPTQMTSKLLALASSRVTSFVRTPRGYYVLLRQDSWYPGSSMLAACAVGTSGSNASHITASSSVRFVPMLASYAPGCGPCAMPAG